MTSSPASRSASITRSSTRSSSRRARTRHRSRWRGSRRAGRARPHRKVCHAPPSPAPRIRCRTAPAGSPRARGFAGRGGRGRRSGSSRHPRPPPRRAGTSGPHEGRVRRSRPCLAPRRDPRRAGSRPSRFTRRPRPRRRARSAAGRQAARRGVVKAQALERRVLQPAFGTTAELDLEHGKSLPGVGRRMPARRELGLDRPSGVQRLGIGLVVSDERRGPAVHGDLGHAPAAAQSSRRSSKGSKARRERVAVSSSRRRRCAPSS